MKEANRRILENSWDVEAWSKLAVDAQTAVPLEAARSIYERLLERFPTAGRHWKAYIDLELNHRNYATAEKLLGRCLLKYPHMDIWTSYLRYVKQRYGEEAPPAAAQGPGGAQPGGMPTGEALEKLKEAFDFALQHIGLDMCSTPIWMEYLALLKAQGSSSKQQQREESNNMMAIRKLYETAFRIPMHNLEQLWRDYDQYENGLSKVLAKHLLSKLSPSYMTSRTEYRNLKAISDGLSKNMLAVPPGCAPGGEKAAAFEKKQVELWKKLIELEKTNPLNLEPMEAFKRVEFAYSQSVLSLYRYPDAWMDFANFYTAIGGADALRKAKEVYDRALEALPDCPLVYFGYAEMLEKKNLIAEARIVYEKLVERAPSPLAFVHFMRFSRRAEGVKQARKVFMSAKKSPACTYHVYLAFAAMEFFVNKERETARKIYELGLKNYVEEPEYVMSYLRFMWNLNEEQNTRVAFNSVLASLKGTPEATREVWDLFLEFEYSCGTIKTIANVEAQMAAALKGYVDLSKTQMLVNRYRFKELWPCGKNILKCLEVEHGPDRAIPGRIRVPQPAAAAFPRPDISTMVEYKSNMSTMTPESLGVPPPPPFNPMQPPMILPFSPDGVHQGAPMLHESITAFLARLPHVHSYTGPKPDVDAVLASLAKLNIPEPTTTGKRKGDDSSNDPNAPASKKSKQPTDIWSQRKAKKLSQKE